jgi:hypothetical protein
MKIEPKWRSTESIVVCTHCNGSGISERDEIPDPRADNDYDYWNELCNGCDGQGRLVKTRHSFRIEYKTPDYKHNWTNAHQDYHHETLSKLESRTTSDIYKIGRR